MANSVLTSHANALVDAKAMIARCYLANYFSIGVQDGITVSGNRFVCKLDADKLLSDAVCLLLDECFLTDELLFIQLAEHRETCHNGRDVCAEFVAIKGKSDLEAKCRDIQDRKVCNDRFR